MGEMSDRYKEGYVKGFQAGRVAGAEEVVRWAEYQIEWAKSGVATKMRGALAHWRKENPEAHFEGRAEQIQEQEPPPDPLASSPLTASEASNLVCQYLESRLENDAYITTLRHGDHKTMYFGDHKWSICTTLGCWSINESTRAIEPIDDRARTVIELYFKR
jgi:hypothetical protein